jgi:chitinase
METVSLIKRMHATSRRQLKTLFSVATLLLAGTSCFASTISLKWDPVTASDLAGYKVYYSTTPTAPFTGTGATQGASPVQVSAQNSATITGLDPGRPYYFAITAYNSAGVESPYSSIVTVPELIPPTVAITSPTSNGPATGTVSVNASASDNVGVSRLEFYVNGVLQGTDTASPYLFSWNTAALSSGVYTLSAKAFDAAGNVGQSGDVTVTVVNDFTPPTVSLSGLADGATVHGTLPVTANASDNIGVTKVEFYANGALIYAGNVAPYSYSLDTVALANGAYTLSAKAYDAAGNVGTSAGVLVNVFNDSIPPVVAIAAPAANSTLSGTVTVSANATDNTGVTKVDFYLNGVLWTTISSAPYSFNWNTLQSANAAYTLSATAYDAMGNAQSASVPVTVFNDLIAPFVNSFTMPAAANSTTVAISGFSATDNVAVTGYLVTESAAVPSASAAGWSQTPQTSFTFGGTGNRTAYAWSKDAKGNVSAGKAALVLVDTVLPVIRSMSISGGSATVTIKATATDNSAIGKLQLYIDGTLRLETAASSFSYAWGVEYQGVHSIVVKAFDTAGNTRSQALSVKK